MKKTPVQELIEELKVNDVAHGMYWIKRPNDFFEKYLEKEKQHIIEAVDKTEAKCVEFCNRTNRLLGVNTGDIYDVKPDEGEDYYNKTYNNESRD